MNSSTTQKCSKTSTPPDQDINCIRCELHKQAINVCLPTIYYDQSMELLERFCPVLLILGQNPGFHEDQQGKPFVGRSGDILKRSYIEGTNLQEKTHIYLGNGVRCHTTNNQAPKPRHYTECNQYLINDLLRIKPTIILTLGAPMTTSFYKNILGIPKVSLTKSFTLNGNLYTHQEHKIGKIRDFHLFSTYHPAAVMRNNNLINSVHSHMQLVSDCVGGVMASPSKPQIVPTRSP